VIVLAAITDYAETRTDGRKLLWSFRRVVPNRVDGIGEPLNAFMYTLYLGVIINAGLFVYTFGTLRFLPDDAQIWIYAGIMVFLGTVLAIVKTTHPKIPDATKVQLARQNAVYNTLVLGNVDVDQQLDFDESMVGKTPEQVKAEKEKEEMLMEIMEVDERGSDYAAIEARESTSTETDGLNTDV